MEQAVEDANADPSIAGVMVYYPVFGSDKTFYGASMDDYLRDSISVEKDVEGLCYTYRNKLYRNQRFLDVSDGGLSALAIKYHPPTHISESLRVGRVVAGMSGFFWFARVVWCFPRT